jgi:hypothetical protein
VNEHFLKLPEADRERGIMTFAHSPPDGNLVAEIWHRHMSGGRQNERAEMSPEQSTELLERLKSFRQQATLSDGDEPGDEMMSLERSVHLKRGSWWQLRKDYKETS